MSVTAWLTRPRPVWVLLAVALAIGFAHALSFLPLPLVIGGGPFWVFPRGTVTGSHIDMGQEFVGYLYLVQAPWMLPLLHIPNLIPPAGHNAFWLDPVPWLGLVGKAIHSVSGAVPNLLGVFLLLCFALPGAAMTGLFAVTGRLGLVYALAAGLLVDAMPILLFEWGHMALCAQFLLILALALYLAVQRWPGDMRVTVWWIVLLLLTLLTHLYLFVMVGGIWAASLAQSWFEGRVAARRVLAEAGAAVLLAVALMLTAGMLSRETREGGSYGFGIFSLNLASPFVPQMSGALPPLREYWVGMRSQVLGYPGLGVFIVVLASLPALPGWLRRRGRAHLALIVVLAAFYVFALSNRVTLGARVLVDVPLPDRVEYALGAFRASGRFFWPVAYAVLAGAIILVVQRYRPRTALALLGVAGVLQVIDAGPLRERILDSALHPPAPVFDRAQVGEVVARAREVVMFPTTGCVAQGAGNPDEFRLLQSTVELQLMAARRDLPVNSVVNSRIATDCAAEAVARGAPLRAGVAYFYLTPFLPSEGQLGGAVCRDIGAVRACLRDSEG